MKLLVSDYDKTLTVDMFQNIEKIKHFVEQKNYFIIATGRNYGLLLEEIKDLNIPYHYLICNDGGIVLDNQNNELFRNNINLKVGYELYNFLKEKDVYNLRLDNGYRYSKNDFQNLNSILFSVTDEKEAKLILKEALKKFQDIIGYITPKSAVFLDKNTDKARAIDFLLTKIKVTKDNIYTIGDGINDYQMLKEYNGFYMAGGSHLIVKKEIKNKASSVHALIDQII